MWSAPIFSKCLNPPLGKDRFSLQLYIHQTDGFKYVYEFSQIFWGGAQQAPSQTPSAQYPASPSIWVSLSKSLAVLCPRFTFRPENFLGASYPQFGHWPQNPQPAHFVLTEETLYKTLFASNLNYLAMLDAGTDPWAMSPKRLTYVFLHTYH